MNYNISVEFVNSNVFSTLSQNDLEYTLNVVNVVYSAPPQKPITSGTTPPSGGVDGDIYLQYTV